MLFECVSVDASRAIYRVGLAAADREYSADATITRADGAIAFGEWNDKATPDTWLVDSARAFLKTIWSNHKDESASEWPKKLRRWRAPK